MDKNGWVPPKTTVKGIFVRHHRQFDDDFNQEDVEETFERWLYYQKHPILFRLRLARFMLKARRN